MRGTAGSKRTGRAAYLRAHALAHMGTRAHTHACINIQTQPHVHAHSRKHICTRTAFACPAARCVAGQAKGHALCSARRRPPPGGAAFSAVCARGALNPGASGTACSSAPQYGPTLTERSYHACAQPHCHPLPHRDVVRRRPAARSHAHSRVPRIQCSLQPARVLRLLLRAQLQLQQAARRTLALLGLHAHSHVCMLCWSAAGTGVTITLKCKAHPPEEPWHCSCCCCCCCHTRIHASVRQQGQHKRAHTSAHMHIHAPFYFRCAEQVSARQAGRRAAKQMPAHTHPCLLLHVHALRFNQQGLDPRQVGAGDGLAHLLLQA